jgi:hypothetical protein
VLPPIHANLLSLIDRANQQANAYCEQLYIRQRNANVARDHQTFVKDAVKNVQQISSAGNSRYSFHSFPRPAAKVWKG